MQYTLFEFLRTQAFFKSLLLEKLFSMYEKTNTGSDVPGLSWKGLNLHNLLWESLFC